MEEFHLVVGLDISRKIPAQHRDDMELALAGRLPTQSIGSCMAITRKHHLDALGQLQ